MSRTGRTAPRLTIGLPVFNGEEYLAESIDALLGQTFEDFHLLIADNVSTDGTADICRRYEKQDSRVRYLRHPRNIGAAPNHNFVVAECRTELFKWASADDLYARDLIQHCVDALDEYPEVVLAHCWTAAVDGRGAITQARRYPLSTDSPRAPERFYSMLFGVPSDVQGHQAADDYGTIQADDCYGVMRTRIVQRIAPHDSYYYADRTFMTELALQGPFHQTPDWLYFRRDHPDRAQHRNPTIRSRCINLDPRRANGFRHPAARLLAEYVLGYIGVIRRAPLSAADRQECYRHLARWLAGRSVPAAGRLLGLRGQRSGSSAGPARAVELPAIAVDALVAGRERGLRAGS